MGFNWQAAGSAAAQGIAETAGMLLTDEVNAQREQRMAAYQQQATQQSQAFQVQREERGYLAQGIQSQMQAEADMQSAKLKREQDMSDMAVKADQSEKEIRLRADLDPRANKIEINNGGEAPDVRGETLSKKLGEFDAELYDEVRRSAKAGHEMEDSLHMLEELQEKFETGKSQDMFASMGAYLGTDEGAARQLWKAATSPMILKKAESMSGVLSDKDMEFLVASVPQYGNDPRANKPIIGLMRKAIQRTLDNESSMNSYYEKNGNVTGWTAPNRQGTNKSAAAAENIGSASDPLSLFD